jgi:hypothetical protein
MKRLTWIELEQVLNQRRCGELLTETPKRLRKATALALAIARWRPERKKGWRGEGENPLCLYESVLAGFDLNCPYCPLTGEGQRCQVVTSIYTKWHDARYFIGDGRLAEKYADEMYNLLCKLYKREYDRC